MRSICSLFDEVKEAQARLVGLSAHINPLSWIIYLR